MGAGATAPTEYDFGAPDQHEQLAIELLNRARAQPLAEAAHFVDGIDPQLTPGHAFDWDLKDTYAWFSVDSSKIDDRLGALPPVPPLAPNAKLMAAARKHSLWMFDTRQQSHVVPPATSTNQSIQSRFSAEAYSGAGMGENIYAFARSIPLFHAGFEVDWGGDDYGMQIPAGHRINDHSSAFREVGIGLHFGTSGYSVNDVGPVVGTQDFGVSVNTPAYVTGVAYYDLNQNGAYDFGEGIGGLRAEVVEGAYFATTGSGGGYVVPVPTTTTAFDLTFSALRASHGAQGSMTGGKNVKLDYVPVYHPPVLSPAQPLQTGVPATLNFPTTVGASSYGWLAADHAAAAPEPCDSMAGITSFVTPGRYALVQGTVRAGTSGSAFHLAHPQREDQWVMLNSTYLPASSGALTFQSRLRGSSVRQIARLQASLDDGVSWTDAWNEVGASFGAEAFAPVSVPLASYAGRLIRLRFAYTISGSSWNAGITTTQGWYVDNISFTNVSQLSAVRTGVVPAEAETGSFTVPPATSASQVFAARPMISGRPWSFGPAAILEASAPVAGYAGWAAEAERALGLPSGSVVNNGATAPMADGVPALVRYALGLSATESADGRLPQPSGRDDGLCVTYVADTSRTDVDLRVQVSGDLTQWFDAGAAGAPAAVQESVVSVSGTIETRCAAIIAPGGRVLARLTATRR